MVCCPAHCRAVLSTMRVVRIPVSVLLTVGKRLQVSCFSARFVSQIAVKEKMPDRKPFSRLQKDVIPKNYAIQLKPDLSKLTFEGQQAITVQVDAVKLFRCIGRVRTRPVIDFSILQCKAPFSRHK